VVPGTWRSWKKSDRRSSPAASPIAPTRATPFRRAWPWKERPLCAFCRRRAVRPREHLGGSEQPVLIELDHDVSLLDDVARGKRRHPVVRQIPADEVEVSRVERADVVPDVAGA
jgi:hypothetical protein